jgi:SAM-dependent methyltransferase
MSANHDKSRISKQNISYYDAIAEGYDDSLNRHDSNRIIRQKVAEKFKQIVKSGSVLDFGGGTGMDLQWLTEKGYSIFFCEPSSAMREKAVAFNKNSLHNEQIVFLDDDSTDFTQWKEQLPFSQKVNAILADFAVINNISDLGLLFESLSLVIFPAGHFLTLVLDARLRGNFLLRWFSKIKPLLFRRPVSFDIRHGEKNQTVFIYKKNEIEKAASPFFDMISHESLHPSGFSLIHLVRK